MGRRILVIDDDAILGGLVARALRERGHEVHQLADGLAGLAAVQATPVPFDLVVTNGRNPRLGRPQLADLLHEIDPTLPVIHIPASHSTRYDHPTLEEHTLFRPFDIWALVDEAEKLMQGPVSQEWESN